MIERFTLADDLMTEFSRGYGGADGIELLRRVQISKRLQLMTILHSAAPDPSRTGAAIGVLGAAQRVAPTAVGAVLADPWTGSWLTRAVRNLLSSEPAPDEVDHLNTVAASAALAARVSADLTLTVRDGRLVLPGAGVSAATGPNARVRIDLSGATVDGAPARFGPVHPLVAADGTTVTLEVFDPYRDCFGVPVDGPPTTAVRRRWQVLFTDAWALLDRLVPRRAAEMRAGLRSLVPLLRPAGAPGVSVTSGDAFGGLGLTLPTDAVDLAVTLVHEFQHSKLSALLDVTRMYLPSVDYRYFAPWRPDPRPVGGFLQGVYAFLAVAETWQAFRRIPDQRERAETELATLRAQLAAALPELRAAPELTDAGRRFTDGFDATLTSLRDVPVTPDVETRAQTAFTRTRQLWRLRHLRPAQSEVEALAAAYPDDPRNRAAAPVIGDTTGFARTLADAEMDPPWPELARAVYLAVAARTGHAPDVASLCGWLGATVTSPAASTTR